MGKTIIDNYMDKRTNVNYTFVPIGVILPYGGGKAPTGFLICDGSAISRVTYKDLFDVIGSHYGDGNGSTTFNVPNLVDKFLRGTATATKIGGVGGADDVTLLTKNLPSHSHGLGNHTHTLSHTHSGTTDNGGVDHTHTWSNSHHHGENVECTDGDGWDNVSNHAQGPMVTHTDITYPQYDSGWMCSGYEGGKGSGFWNSNSWRVYTDYASISGTTSSASAVNHTHSFGTSDASNTTTSQATGNTDSTGSDTAFSIVPSYVNVQYIMKY